MSTLDWDKRLRINGGNYWQLWDCINNLFFFFDKEFWRTSIFSAAYPMKCCRRCNLYLTLGKRQHTRIRHSRITDRQRHTQPVGWTRPGFESNPRPYAVWFPHSEVSPESFTLKATDETVTETEKELWFLTVSLTLGLICYCLCCRWETWTIIWVMFFLSFAGKPQTLTLPFGEEEENCNAHTPQFLSNILNPEGILIK